MKKSKLSKYKKEKLVEYFVAKTTARTASKLIGINKNTAAYFYLRLRKLIDANSPKSPMFLGPTEADESYFGGKRKGKRGRGAAGKIPVFGILKRGGKVYTQVVPDVKANTLISIIKEQVRPDSIVYTDTLSSYNKLDVSGFKHHRINHSKKFVEKANHINGIENFWSQAKRDMRKFNGIKKEHFPLFLQECQWRFNNPDLKVQLKQLRRWVKLYL